MLTPIEIPVEQILKRYSYDPVSGKFTRLKKTPTQPAGSVVMHGVMPYCRIGCGGRFYLAHRVAWAIVYGSVEGNIDHIDGNKTNNAISNLRIAAQDINSQNIRFSKKNSKTGLLGAHFNKKQNAYNAQIRANGKIIHIGSYKTAEAAHRAYLEAKRIFHQGCTI